MENYIVINGVHHDLMRQKDVHCRECSLNDYCSRVSMPCSIFANHDWDAISDFYFVLHSNS